ncbi:MAG: hypothetical protein KDD35_07560 [Bdellovibrionales bacterium]|nr:hypothetical protein [Bdellovibrionales bacterium]
MNKMSSELFEDTKGDNSCFDGEKSREDKVAKFKRSYFKPEVKSENIGKAELGKVCNGSSAGGRKASGPICSTLLS